MRERPIIFSAPMVRAILAGAKTQTRRVVKMNDRSAQALADAKPPVSIGGGGVRWFARGQGWNAFCRIFGAPGDRLWVREALRFEAAFNDLPPREVPPDANTWYEATDEWRYSSAGKLRPGMFLPRWASRITLEVTGVRVERLQDISADDARDEGLDEETVRCEGECGATPCSLLVPTFKRLWDTINGKRAPWASNPWVWVIEFKRLERECVSVSPSAVSHAPSAPASPSDSPADSGD